MLNDYQRTINLSKYGSFPANRLIGRPYYLTYEIQDEAGDSQNLRPQALRVVPAAEIYAGIDEDDTSTPNGEGKTKKGEGGVEYDILGEDGQLIMRTNRQILDTPESQILSMSEIESLKAEKIPGKDLISKILDSHSALDQKTAFALAKYTLRKTKKYLKRFTVLPLDVSTLAKYVFYDKDALKSLEMREEILALIGSWSNAHYTPADSTSIVSNGDPTIGRGRWLVLDETSGLLVAYLAEKMGVLHETAPRNAEAGDHKNIANGLEHEDVEDENEIPSAASQTLPPAHKRHPQQANANTLHLIHSASQPNLSLLKYFNFDHYHPSPNHPLSSHLKTLSWLQLLDPNEDGIYTKPEEFPLDVIRNWKAARRSNYYRKFRRWERVKSAVDETRAGGFDGLVMASVMQPLTALQQLIPLLRGGAKVVVYSRHLEPLTELVDFYSSSRRTAFVGDPPDPSDMPTEDFPVDPSLLLAATIHTARAKSWQVLPGRTHPLMTGKGGADGFIFTATRVLPAEGKVTARGTTGKRRKTGAGNAIVPEQDMQVENDVATS